MQNHGTSPCVNKNNLVRKWSVRSPEMHPENELWWGLLVSLPALALSSVAARDIEAPTGTIHTSTERL